MTPKAESAPAPPRRTWRQVRHYRRIGLTERGDRLYSLRCSLRNRREDSFARLLGIVLCGSRAAVNTLAESSPAGTPQHDRGRTKPGAPLARRFRPIKVPSFTTVAKQKSGKKRNAGADYRAGPELLRASSDPGFRPRSGQAIEEDKCLEIAAEPCRLRTLDSKKRELYHH